jgi:hypothetical protein
MMTIGDALRTAAREFERQGAEIARLRQGMTELRASYVHLCIKVGIEPDAQVLLKATQAMQDH